MAETGKGSSGEDGDATVFAATSSRKAFQKSASASDTTVRVAEAKAIDPAQLSGINPLVAAANQLLSLVPQLRTSVSYSDQNALRELLRRQLDAFDKLARERGITAQQCLVARYALCALLDESISHTPWGGGGQWARFGLLVTLHNDAAGGEKFFLLLGKMAEDPAKNIALLELMYVALALGFEGKYRVMPAGKAQLEEVREKLYNMIRKQRGEAERDLSPHWRGLHASTTRTVRFLPLWATMAVMVLLLAATFIGLNLALNQRSDSVFGILAKLRVPVVRTAVAAKPVQPRLRVFLEEEIKRDMVEVSEDDISSRVSIKGDGLFELGSAVIDKPYEPVVARIVEALNKVPGQVIVAGHTDNQPMRTARFPSNWHLSQERAQSVARLMSKTIDSPDRLKAEGLADNFPIVSNDSPANMKRNRRVEITLKVRQ